MPCYEWACLGCGYKFETIQKMSDPNPFCPECEFETEKQMSAGSFHLKGGGWAADNYQKKEKK